MKLVYGIKDKPKFGALILFAFQQLLAILAATIAVPSIIGNGMSQSAALFGAGVGTFMSPCEKACGNAIYKAGGSIVVLSPEGFAPRWHPPRNKESLCAEGRLMFLSLYEPSAARPDNATLYRRCHEMGDAVVAGLRGEAEL